MKVIAVPAQIILSLSELEIDNVGALSIAVLPLIARSLPLPFTLNT